MQVTDMKVFLPTIETMRQAKVATMQLFVVAKIIGMTDFCLKSPHGVL
jgi:hypothetical protein